MVFERARRVGSAEGRVTWGRTAVAATEDELIADIMGAQHTLQQLFAYDRSDPLFSSHLTLSQLKILMLLARDGNVSGGELARRLGVGLAALSGMIDRLVAQDRVARTEDLRDRRVRRIGLTKAGSQLIESIINAGADKQRRLLSRLSAEELSVVAQGMQVMVRVATADLDCSGEIEGAGRG
jgi:DNA-binding MarR family transcriptional regulator